MPKKKKLAFARLFWKTEEKFVRAGRILFKIVFALWAIVVASVVGYTLFFSG